MTEAQISLVQRSFQAIRPSADVVAGLFYARLFALDPSLRALFRSDPKEQGRKLMHMLGIAVKGLSRLDEILPAVEELGRRHVRYGVHEEHYETVGQALLWTLEIGLGLAFTSELRSAWEAAYALLASAMQRAAGDVEPEMMGARA